MIDERGQRLVDDGLLVLMNAAPRADAVQAAGRGGGRSPGCWRSTPPSPTRQRRTPCAADYVVGGAGDGGAAAAARRQGGARGGGRAGAGHQAAGAAAAPARRRRRPAVLDPVGHGLGAGRDPRPAEVCALGGARRVLGAAAAAGQRRVRRRSQPVRGQLGVRARSRLPGARRVRGLRRRRRAAARCPTGWRRASRPPTRRRWSTGARCAR